LIPARKNRAINDDRGSVPSEISCEIVKEKVLFDLYIGDSGINDPDNIIESKGNAVPVLSYYFPQDPFYSISFYRMPTFF